jgi:hypothetical protein
LDAVDLTELLCILWRPVGPGHPILWTL